jgi:hypothetical protein
MKRRTLSQDGFIPMMLFFLALLLIGLIFAYLRVKHAKG